MKKTFLSALCAIGLSLFSNNANAQLLADIEGMPPYKLGVTAGFNISTFSAGEFSIQPGYNVGVDLMLDASELINNTYLRVNLMMQRKGASFNWYELDKKSSHKPIISDRCHARTYYLEIPVSYGYAWRIDRNWALMAETGPYLAVGLGGNYKTKNYDDESVKFFNNNVFRGEGNHLIHSPKRLDFGWGFGFGGMFLNSHQIKLSYEFGFLNMCDELQQNRSLMVNYSFFFE